MSSIAPTSQGSQYSDTDRERVVAHYVACGNVERTSRETNVPATTLRDWMKTEWWAHLDDEIRRLTKDSTIARLEGIVASALDASLDRIEHGDYHVVREGGEARTMRVPMRGKDLAVTAAVAIDKSRLLQSLPTSIRGEAQGINDLVAQFERLAARHEKVVSEQD